MYNHFGEKNEIIKAFPALLRETPFTLTLAYLTFGFSDSRPLIKPFSRHASTKHNSRIVCGPVSGRQSILCHETNYKTGVNTVVDAFYGDTRLSQSQKLSLCRCVSYLVCFLVTFTISKKKTYCTICPYSSLVGNLTLHIDGIVSVWYKESFSDFVNTYLSVLFPSRTCVTSLDGDAVYFFF